MWSGLAPAAGINAKASAQAKMIVTARRWRRRRAEGYLPVLLTISSLCGSAGPGCVPPCVRKRLVERGEDCERSVQPRKLEDLQHSGP
jgi:hypothetical protein